MLDNLFDNALRYGCPDRGGNIITHLHTSDERLTISISDNGPGIPETLLPTLFERFTRGTEDGAGGCGLGLAISQSIIIAHEGEITVNSSEKGTIFTRL